MIKIFNRDSKGPLGLLAGILKGQSPLRGRSPLRAYVGTRVLDTPFWGLYVLLPFILYRDLGASPFQIAMLLTLKPLSSLLAGYWGSFVFRRPDRLVSNIMWARILGYLPFFFFPFVSDPWFFIFAHGFYMMFAVGAVPAWMEILKRTSSEEERGKLFSYCQVFGYMGGGLLPFVIGFLLDGYAQSWRWLFPLAAVIGLMALVWQRKVVLEGAGGVEPRPNFLEYIKAPWKNSWQVLKERKDFLHYQLAFMLFGAGLMVMQPALPVFFVDRLKLSYTEMAVAITLCKGVGYAITSPWISGLLREKRIFIFSSGIAFLACLFPFCILLAQWQVFWLYVAYVLYGVTQSGSEFSWNMSGPIFSRQEDSSIFSSVNILAVGMRGAIIPPLGSLLLVSSDAVLTLILGGVFCFLSAFALRWSGKTLLDPQTLT